MIAAGSLSWYTARASGLVAWGLLAFGVFLGLALSTKVMGRKPTAPWLLDLHRFTGGLSVLFVLVHIGALMTDRFVHFGLEEVLIPLTSSYRPWSVAAGTVALYLLVAVQLTSLAMRKIPRRWWKAVHSCSFLLFLVTTAHVLGSGTDVVNPATRIVAVGLLFGFVFLVSYRWLAPSRSERRTTGRTMPVPTSARTRDIAS